MTPLPTGPSTLTPQDLHRVVARLPKDVRELLQTNDRTYLAGGFIRAVVAGENPNDIDLFGYDAPALQRLADALALGRDNARVHKSPNAITVLTTERMPVQFITRWVFAHAYECANSFDFTVCKAVVWYEAGLWRSTCDPTFYSDLAARRLTYTSPTREEESGGSMMRVLKYVKRGYCIQPASLGAVIARLSDAVVAGTGANSATVITGLLREVDPALAIDGLDILDEVHAHDVDVKKAPAYPGVIHNYAH